MKVEYDKKDCAQAEPNLAKVFPLYSLVFWATLAKWPGQDSRIDQKIHVFRARIAAQNAEMDHSDLRCTNACRIGEFEAMLLAAAHRRYLPCYTSLLRHWDMGHGARAQHDTIHGLALAHGPSPEVDELIATRLVEAPGQHGFAQVRELLPKIVEWYGDPLASPVHALAAQKLTALGYADHSGLEEVFATDRDEE